MTHRDSAKHRFCVGQQVRLARELHGLEQESVGVIRGASASAEGVRYAVRFGTLTRVVAETNLRPRQT